MKRSSLLCGTAFTLAAALAAAGALAAPASEGSAGPYKVLKVDKVGGTGGFDYVYADPDGRRLYIPRSGDSPRISVYNLDTLAAEGEIPLPSGTAAPHGAAVDPKSNHGFATSKPVIMWDAKTLAPIKTIAVDGGPDGIFFDPFDAHVHILSHRAPNDTVINAADGTIAGTIDLGGAPEQTVSDGKGHLYVDIEDKSQVAVVDAKTMAVTARYDLAGKGGTPAGLAFDPKSRVLFVACRTPATMVMMNADTGKIIDALPIGAGVDGATFNPNTMEAFASQGDGTLTVIKENSPTSFAVEQTVHTPTAAKTLTLDPKTNRVLLIAAEFGPPPAQAPAAGGRPARGPMLPDSFSIVMVGK